MGFSNAFSQQYSSESNSAVLDQNGNEKIEKPNTPQLLSKPEKNLREYQRRRQRIIVISPYHHVNSYIQQSLESYMAGVEVEDLYEGEQETHPYIDVPQRERGRVKPEWIIDFGIIQKSPYILGHGKITTLTPFTGYKEWANQQHILYVTPKHSLIETLKERHVYDRDGNFLTEHIAINDIEVDIDDDMFDISRGKLTLKLFSRKIT